MESIWTKTVRLPQFPALTGDMKTDVLIIGGGMAGILCAYMLKEAGVDYVLAEADRICGGITKDTTAKITFQHGFIYDKLIGRFGAAGAKVYLDANRAALDRFGQMCRFIDCDFETVDSYVYTNNRAKMEAEAAALSRLGASCDMVYSLPIAIPNRGAVRVKAQAQFHPLKFINGIAKDLNIWENTKVLELEKGGAVTNHGRIKAKKIIIATHFPILNKHGLYFLKLYQHRSYVIALKNAPKFEGMYVDEKDSGMSFRRYGDLLLLGGGGHRTGKKGGNWKELTDFAKKHYPDATITARWATQDCMSLDSVPYIGQYAKSTPDLFTAAGFNKWGMTGSMVSAMILAEAVQGRTHPYASFFSPCRSMLTARLAVNAAESTLGLLTPTLPRCPHLGCALRYNSAEHSWDCPCHGSRFDEKGNLINNPATDDKHF